MRDVASQAHNTVLGKSYSFINTKKDSYSIPNHTSIAVGLCCHAYEAMQP